MPSMKTHRNRKARQASRLSLQLECLESRLPLAGNVTAQLVGSTLFLTGDALGNELVVASAKAGTIAVLGNGTTINGANTSITPFVTTKPVTNIVANLNGGNDFIGFSNDATGLGNQLLWSGITLTPAFDAGALQAAIGKVAPGITTFSLPGSLTVTTADGDDAVGIIGNVGGSVAVNLGSAIASSTFTGNELAIGDPVSSTITTRIGGGLSVVGGNQNDFASLYATSVTGAVSAALGNGTYNGLDLDDSTIGSLTVSGGSGEDYVDTAALTVRNGVSVSTGAGKDEVYLHEHGGPLTVVGGSVVINTGADDDYVELGIDARQGVSVITAGGNDAVYSYGGSKVGLGLTINTGDGNDIVDILDTYVDQNAVIDAGAGNDKVDLTGTTIRYNLFAYLGAGNDTVAMRNVRALGAYLYGGTGVNSLGTDPATRAGIRTLRYYQFQNVNRP